MNSWVFRSAPLGRPCPCVPSASGLGHPQPSNAGIVRFSRRILKSQRVAAQLQEQERSLLFSRTDTLDKEHLTDERLSKSLQERIKRNPDLADSSSLLDEAAESAAAAVATDSRYVVEITLRCLQIYPSENCILKPMKLYMFILKVYLSL